ncbi:MAG: hypothetical protein QOG13_2352 [Sphingomonadales bacterium]|jgi:hypothetical protein|nr:hypothetical protein [Sphingomonadales bacterium]
MADRRRRWAGVLLVLGTLLIAAGPAAACPTRKAFHEREAGAVAYLTHARVSNPQDDRRDWCQIAPGAPLRVPREATRLFFAVNNRSPAANIGSHMIIKVYRRRTASTQFRSPLTLGRSGPWTNAPCGAGASDKFYLAPWPNAPPNFWGTAQWSVPPAVRRRPCNPLNSWLGEAFGDGRLSLAYRAPFLQAVPRMISSTGPRQWTLDLFAQSYLTVEADKLGGLFPVFNIERAPGDHLLVQVWVEQAGRVSEFEIPPS